VLDAVSWWVYFVLAAIIYCGYRALMVWLEDRRVDQEHIEEQGKEYIQRMEEEKKKRKSAAGG
jgi:hypothetical protein